MASLSVEFAALLKSAPPASDFEIESADVSLEAPAICRLCGQPERIVRLAGVAFTNLSQRLGACTDCISTEIQQLHHS
jgi:hypothetical protein